MKRASDVPPPVSSFGSMPVAALIALRMISIRGPGLVTNDSPLMEESRSNRSAYRARVARTQAVSEAPLCPSLNRMFSAARADAGITLVALLPTSMLVTCSVEGSNQPVPASTGADVRASSARISRCTGLSARCG